MRATAVVFALLTAVGQLALFAYGEAQLDLALFDQVGAQLGPWWSRAMWAVGWSLPWFVGATLLAWGPARVGTSVLVAIAVLSIAESIEVVRLVLSASGGARDGVGLVGVVGAASVWAVGIAAGVAAWLARPRGDWRLRAPGPGGAFTAAAIAAWLPTAFHASAFAPPGAPRRFIEPYATGIDLSSAGVLIHPALVALVLLVAPRLRPAVAGAVTLTFALPQFVSYAATVRSAVLQDLMIPTPAGVLGVVGGAALIVIGAAWMVRGPRRVSGATTDPDPAAGG